MTTQAGMRYKDFIEQSGYMDNPRQEEAFNAVSMYSSEVIILKFLVNSWLKGFNAGVDETVTALDKLVK